MSDLPVNSDKQQPRGTVVKKPSKPGHSQPLGPFDKTIRLTAEQSAHLIAAARVAPSKRGVDLQEKPAAPEADEFPYAAPRAIRVERAGVEPLVVPLYPDRTYIFGRSSQSSFVFTADSVSREHGRLSTGADGRWLYRDLNSSNGTKVTRGPLPAPGAGPIDAWPIGQGREREVQAGWTLILGNGESRVALLAEVPEEVARRTRPGASSKASLRLEKCIDVCAHHRMNVFLLGASGTGKTYAARVIHERSRMEGNFVIVSCARLPQDPAQLTSELLGHVKGSYTGATVDRTGKLQSADQGTLFLDEVESLSRTAQDFLLDVLEGSGSFAPHGAQPDARVVPPRFRVISASKKPLLQSGLRPDLCQRLAMGDLIILPTLAERREDIPRLVESFVQQLRAERQIQAELTEDAIRFLEQADWPGEVRELETAVKVVVSREHANRHMEGAHPKLIVVGVKAVKAYLEERAAGFGMGAPPQATPVAAEGTSVGPPPRKRPADLTKADLSEALQQCGGNKTRAAQLLGIALNTLKGKMGAFGSE
jgi:DNA-binding NtrC family response regulator